MLAFDQTAAGGAAVIGRACRNQIVPAPSIAHSISRGLPSVRSSSSAALASARTGARRSSMPELEFGGAAELSTSPLARATATVPGVTSPLTSFSPRPSQYFINIDAGAHPAGARGKKDAP